MTKSLGRRHDQFRAKVQQKIVLADDEIARCQEYLGSLEAELAEYQDKQRRLQLRAGQREQEKLGRKKQRQVTKQMQAAAMTSAHNSAIAELADHHKQECDALHHDFELQLGELHNYERQQIAQKVGPVEDKIKGVSASIARIREQIAEVANQAGDEQKAEIQATQQMEAQRIQVLEQSLREKNKGRLDDLLQAREDLGECIRTLEEMEDKHEGEVLSLIRRLETQTATYDQKVRAATEQNAKETDALKRRLREADAKARQARKALRALEKHFNRELGKVAAENEQLKADLANLTSSEVVRRKGDTEVLQIDARLEQAKAELQNKEDALLQLRAESQRIRREIARITHEAAIAKRRAALNLG
jgi:chromosome segregation ATPase